MIRRTKNNSLGESFAKGDHVYWYQYRNHYLELKDVILFFNVNDSYAEPKIIDDESGAYSRTALSKSKIGAAFLLEELRELMKMEYGEQTINF